MLVYAMEAEDFARGTAAYASSRHRIDVEHRATMQECLGQALDVRTLYDVAAS